MEEKNMPFLERFMDNPIGLLIFSSAIFAVSYFIWGAIVVMSTPPIPEAFKELILGGK